MPSKNNIELHYNNPTYDFLLLADEGWMMYKNDDIERYNGNLPVKGMHGYDSSDINMHAIFYAYGPQFKKNMEIDNIYQLCLSYHFFYLYNVLWHLFFYNV